jgi:hypothetical protein
MVSRFVPCPVEEQGQAFAGTDFILSLVHKNPIFAITEVDI